MLWCRFPSDLTERHVHSYRSTHLHIIYITLYYFLFIYLFIIYTGSSWKHDGTRRRRRAMCVHVTSSQTFTCGHQDSKGNRFTFVETGDRAKTGGVTFKKPWPLAASTRVAAPQAEQPRRLRRCVRMFCGQHPRCWQTGSFYYIWYLIIICYYNSGGGCAAGAWGEIARLIKDHLSAQPSCARSSQRHAALKRTSEYNHKKKISLKVLICPIWNLYPC